MKELKMKTKTLQKKISRHRFVKSQILKYIRQNTEIIEDLYSNHTGEYKIPARVKPNIVIIDWEKVVFLKRSDLGIIFDIDRELLINRDSLLSTPGVIVMDRWF